jgi:hypothetical protein
MLAYSLDFFHRAELLVVQDLVEVHNDLIQQSDKEGGEGTRCVWWVIE